MSTKNDIAAVAAVVAIDLPKRIEPVVDGDGKPVHLAPPCGGDWIRDPDGGLSPANEATATAAGLGWSR
jgi:hypothetical protein